MSHDASACRPLLLRPHGEEEAEVGMAVLEAEAQEEGGAFRDGPVLAPGPPAPVETRGENLFLRVALGSELGPRDIGLRIPLEGLGPLPELPDIGHGGRELERIAGLGEIGRRHGSLLHGMVSRRVMRGRAPDG
jgi:hypothetical protein